MTESTVSLRAPFAPGEPYELDRARCRKLLETALSKGGDTADVYAEFAVGGSMVLDEGIVKSASRGVSLGVGVRVRKGDAAGYAYTEDLSWEALVRAAETAAQIATGNPVAPQDVTERSVPSRYNVKVPSLLVSGFEKRELLLQADRAARAADPRITRVEASLNESYREVLMATSVGIFARDIQPMIRFGVRAIAEENGKRQSGSSGGGGRMGLEYFSHPGKSPVEHAQEAVRSALAMLDAREAPAGEMDVVLAPGDSGVLLHEAVGHGLEADFNRKGVSNYSGRVGSMVASELCTIVDDGDVPFNRGAVNVDDEGNVPACATLIEKGVLRGYMHDAHSAKHFGVAPTGNGRRESFRSVPMPRMTTTMLLAGPHDPEEIVKSVKKGVFARKFGGGQVDIASGDFVFSISEAYLIEDGKITAPLKDVNLIGNGPDALGKVTMLGTDLAISDGIWTCGKDGQSVPVGVACPTIKISGMTVGGTDVSR
ncbi:MAG: metallopeptidase TldD-related protein [Deltaproteobacteria bacterium]|nr:metallopeptidase TldD-related protein [Deltaproteobacteria bacterium]